MIKGWNTIVNKAKIRNVPEARRSRTPLKLTLVSKAIHNSSSTATTSIHTIVNKTKIRNVH